MHCSFYGKRVTNLEVIAAWSNAKCADLFPVVDAAFVDVIDADAAISWEDY